VSSAIFLPSLPLRTALERLSREPQPDLAIASARSGTSPAAQPPPAHEPLSEIARAIAALARSAAVERAQGLEPAVLTRIGTPHPDTRAAGAELRAAFERSGLFYESHLGDWSAGTRTREELMREPQARLRAAVARASLASEEAAAAGAAAQRPADATASASPALPPRALEVLMREQLATLETRAAVLPLLAWPGQEALLEIGEEPPAERDRDEDGAVAGKRRWQARIALDLPHLGAVALAVSLAGERVEVRARTAHDRARLALAAGAAELREALLRNALALERFVLADDRS
jgi:hypothetical protein